MTTESSESTGDGLTDKARQAIADCPICQGIEDNGGSSHYHCAVCGEECSVMGHSACDLVLTRTLAADQERENAPTSAGELARIAADYRRLVGLEKRVAGLVEKLRANAKGDITTESDYQTGWRHGMLNASNIIYELLDDDGSDTSATGNPIKEPS